MKCPFCRRETPENFVEKHHLTPKYKKGKEVIYLCCDCGDQIHLLFSNFYNGSCNKEELKEYIKNVRKKYYAKE